MMTAENSTLFLWHSRAIGWHRTLMSYPSLPALWQWGFRHLSCQPVEIVGNIFSTYDDLFENITCLASVVRYLCPWL
jgi:hypothetical protein